MLTRAAEHLGRLAGSEDIRILDRPLALQAFFFICLLVTLLGITDAGAADTPPAGIDIGVAFIIGMILRAAGFASLEVSTVPDGIMNILRGCSIQKIFRPVVTGNVIPVPDHLSRRAWSEKSLGNEAMNVISFMFYGDATTPVAKPAGRDLTGHDIMNTSFAASFI